MNYWQNYPKFMVSLLKAAYGKTATKDNDFGYAWLPKIDGNYSWMYIFDDMYRGTSTRAGGKEPGPEGLITFGMNPVGIGPNSKKMIGALSKLKWMVVVENYEIETATFWKAPKEYGGARAVADPDRGLPAARRRLRREGRHVHQLGALDAVEVEGDRPARPGEDRPGDPGAPLARGARPLPEGGRRAARAGAQPDWSYTNPATPDLGEVAQGDQRQGARRHPGSEGSDQDRPQGRRSSSTGSAQLQDDGSTMCGNWLHSGVLHRGGQQLAQRRNNADPTGLGMFHDWALLLARQPPRHVQPRLGRRARASPGIRRAPGIVWNGEKWVGDVPDIKPDSPPGQFGAFIMNRRRRRPALLRRSSTTGPFPEHYEAIEAPVDNPLHPKVTSNPVVEEVLQPTRTSTASATSSRSSAPPTG